MPVNLLKNDKLMSWYRDFMLLQIAFTCIHIFVIIHTFFFINSVIRLLVHIETASYHAKV